MSFFDYFSKAVSYLEDPSTKPAGLAAIYGGISGAGTAMPGATTGTDAIPDYEFVRERVPMDYDEERRPGSRGRRYFSDFVYAPAGAGSSYASDLGIQAAALAAANQANMGVEPKFTAPDYQQSSLTQTGTPASQVGSLLPVPKQGGLTGFSPQYTSPEAVYKRGGLAALARGGYYLGGTTDGMADRVPARIDGVEEARLSDGEFVVPADVVSHLGNGNSNAGAKQLYSMMDRVRQARTGRTEQGKEINPKQFMPSQGQRS